MKYILIEKPVKEFEEELKEINKYCYIKNNEAFYLIIDVFELGIKEFNKLLGKFPETKFYNFDKKDLEKFEYEDLCESINTDTIYDELYLLNDNNNLKICTLEDVIYEKNNIIESHFNKEGDYIFIIKTESIDILLANTCELYNSFLIGGTQKIKEFSCFLIIWADKLYIKNINTAETVYEKKAENDFICFYKNNIIINNKVIDPTGEVTDLNNVIDTNEGTLITGDDVYLLDYEKSFVFVNKNNERIARKLENVIEKNVWFKKNTLFMIIEKNNKGRFIRSLDIYKGSDSFSLPLNDNEEICTTDKFISVTSDNKTTVYKISKYLDSLLEIKSRAKHIDFTGEKIAFLFESYFEIYNKGKLITKQSCLSGNQINWSPNGLFIAVFNIKEMSAGACEIYDINGYLIRKMYVNLIKQFEWRGYRKLDISTKREINENWDKYKTSLIKKEYNKSVNKNVEELRNNWVSFLLKQKELLN